MIQQLFAIILEEDAEAKLNDEDKTNYKETKTIQQILRKGKRPIKGKVLIFDLPVY